MNIRMLVSIVAVAALTLSACSQKKVTEVEDPAINSQNGSTAIPAEAVSLPAFSMQDKEGNMVSLQSLKGKKVFLNLWASWCPPCREEMPSIERLYKSADTARVAFVMLSLDDNFEKAKRYVSSRKLTLPIFYPAENLPDLFNVEGIPVTFIFNEEGKLIKQINGSEDYDSDNYRTLFK
jgi:thiol-disulfide isomerase/thioredoxin